MILERGFGALRNTGAWEERRFYDYLGLAPPVLPIALKIRSIRLNKVAIHIFFTLRGKATCHVHDRVLQLLLDELLIG